ncbi:MAG: hypothetical protein J5545_04070 [Bacteroidaceae bacterium]|nr:hypothetical protein [Bacteroidaceae bacterium]
MKKHLKLLLCAALGLGLFTACEDVPEPYNIPTENGNTTPTADYIISQSFTSSLGDFSSQSESGTLAWTSSSKYGAIITGYDDWDGSGQKSNKPGVTYLISPEIDLSDCDSAYVVVDQAINYSKNTLAEDHHLLVRLAGTETWTELPMSLDGLGTSFTYVTSNTQLPQEYIGQKVQLALKHVAHDSYSSTWEVKSLKVAKGTAPKAGNGDTPVEDLVGSGTKDDPYDVPSTIKLIAAGPPSTKIYTKGVVSKVDEINEQYGNATYYISNDGTTTDQLEVYRGLGLGGAKFKNGGLAVGDTVIVYGQVVFYNNKTMEFTQGSELYYLNGEYAGGGEEPGEAKGTGTLEDPFNGAAANAAASALASGATSDQAYYIKGKVVSVKEAFSAQYGNASFYISDDGSTTGQFYVYRSLYLGNRKWTSSDDQIEVGDEVIVYAKLTNYKGNTPETVQGETYLYSHKGKTEGGGDNPNPTPGEEKGSGTLEDPYNAVAATNIAKALASGAKTDQAYYIQGKVASVKEAFSAQYGNASFYISDDGSTSNQFYVFRALYLGNQKWVSGNTQIKVGDEVIIYAKLTNYQGNTPETVQGDCYLYSLNGKTEDNGSGGGGGDDPNPGGDTKTLADFANGDFETWADGLPTGWQSTSSASNADLAQSTDAHGGSYSVKVGGTSSGNKRLAYEELELEAGTYNCAFWTKAATASAASLCPGYAAVGSSITYYYDKGEDGKNKYVNDIVQEWQQVTYSFTLAEKTTVNLIIMNSKTTGTDLLIDDFTITKQ